MQSNEIRAQIDTQSNKLQGDKLDVVAPETSLLPKLVLENRPVDSDLDKKQGDPLLSALPTDQTREEIHTGKLARELPEYHQGEARLKPATVDAKIEAEAATEQMIASAQVLAENAKEIAIESKEFVQAKTQGLYQSAVEEADVLLNKAYEGEQYLVNKAVDAEMYIEDKGKQALKTGQDLLVNTIAPAVGYALGRGYVALAAVTGVAMEKGKEGLEILENEAIEKGTEAYALGQEMAKEAEVLGHEAKIVAQENLAVAAEKTKEGLAVAAEKTMEGLAVAAELGKEGLAIAAEKTMEGMAVAAELGKEGMHVAADKMQVAAEMGKEGMAVASEMGKEGLAVAAQKTQETAEYLGKEAAVLSYEASEFMQHQKEVIVDQTQKMAEESKHNPEAASLLRELADDTEIRAPLTKSTSSDRITDAMRIQLEVAAKLKLEQDRLAREARLLEHERQLENSIANKLTDSLRQTAAEYEDRLLEEGVTSYQEIQSPIVIAASKEELKPLLPHVAPTTLAEPRTASNV